MYNYLLGLDFEQTIKELDSRNIEYDFGDSTTIEDIRNIIKLCKEESDLYNFEDSYIYINGFWSDNHIEIYFNDDMVVTKIYDDFEGWN